MPSAYTDIPTSSHVQIPGTHQRFSWTNLAILVIIMTNNTKTPVHRPIKQSRL